MPDKDFTERIHDQLDKVPDGVSFMSSSMKPSQELKTAEVRAMGKLFRAIRPLIERAKVTGERFL